MIPSSASQRGTRTGNLQRRSEISETVPGYIKPEVARMRTHNPLPRLISVGEVHDQKMSYWVMIASSFIRK